MKTKDWYSAAELCGYPGLPKTKRAVLMHAKRDAWKYRPRQGRGGGREYHIDCLPTPTKNALRANYVVKDAALVAQASRWDRARKVIGRLIIRFGRWIAS